MICLIVLWLGVGNVLSVLLPIRDRPIKNRGQSGTLKQFIIAFTLSYLIGYLVNLTLIWLGVRGPGNGIPAGRVIIR